MIKVCENTQALNLVPGDWISLAGEQEFKGNFTKLKLKAYEITRLSCNVKCDQEIANEATVTTQGKTCPKKG